MPDIKQREEKMWEKIKNIPRKEFIFRLASWKSFMFYKNPEVTLYPPTGRVGPLLSAQDYEKQRIWFEKYGIDYDFGKDFFHHYQQLFTTIPCMRLKILPPYENSDYIDSWGFGIKNCYLSIGPFSDSQNVLYSFEVKEKCSDVLNSVMVRHNCANIYQSTGIINSYKIFYSRYVSDSSNLRFCTNMIGCQECIDCDGLQNQSYCIGNKQYSKEEFATKKEEILNDKNGFHEKFLKLKVHGKNLQSANVEGSFNVKCNNIGKWYLNFNVHGGNNLILVGSANGNKEIYNTFVCGSPHMDHGYHVLDSWGGDYIYNGERIAMSSHIYYSFYLENCSYCLWCIWLKNKQFYILNKQYAKEERFTLADKIFAQMGKDGSLWKYFPGYINPFYFNDTAAYLIDDSFTKEEVAKEWYLRRDEEIKVDIPPEADIVETKNLSSYQWFENDTWTINPEILKKVIKDEKGNYYRIVKMEYDFLMKYGLPLPELHRLERIKLWFKFK